MKRFGGELIFKAHELLYDSTLASRVIKKKKKKDLNNDESQFLGGREEFALGNRPRPVQVVPREHLPKQEQISYPEDAGAVNYVHSRCGVNVVHSRFSCNHGSRVSLRGVRDRRSTPTRPGHTAKTPSPHRTGPQSASNKTTESVCLRESVSV